MKVLLFATGLSLGLSAAAAAAAAAAGQPVGAASAPPPPSSSPAEVISGYARACYLAVGGQESLALEQALHGAEPGTTDESQAKLSLDKFNQDLKDFSGFEANCNQTLNGDDRFTCYSQGYARETRRLADEYSLGNALLATPACAYLEADQ